MSASGNALIVAGILVLAGVIYIGYTLYLGINSVSLTVLPNLPANESVSKSVNALVSGLLSSSNSFLLVFLKVIILFLFAGIGYKLAALGISQNKAVAEIENEAKAASSVQEAEKGKGFSKY